MPLLTGAETEKVSLPSDVLESQISFHVYPLSSDYTFFFFVYGLIVGFPRHSLKGSDNCILSSPVLFLLLGIK